MSVVWPKVYLAGPGVFRPNAAEIGAELKALCARYRLEGLWPADNEPPSKLLLCDQAKHIYEQNLQMIRVSRAIIADISPFRGPHMDCGTAWEIGAGVVYRKPVFAYTSDLGDLALRIVRTLDGDVWRDDDGNLVEHFGAPENLMICCSVEVICKSAEEALQHCVKHLRSVA